ncbi:permease [Microbulbifer sp. THAF38]|uniref:permease n=1 Tax=Microbulbifer sp. THAF38 TaxID=2587856 RepID=UPI001267E997|nr:permease [Microbulbifer sp. THAF38]QFT54811.1 putative permease [Microbulbifer sp. THAF38]
MSVELVTMLEEALNMFAFLAVELTVLFLAISYLVGVLQEYISPDRVQAALSSRRGKGYLIAALLGVITPFCSCSTIPFIKGLLRAQAGFGPVVVFLFSSPLLNPIVIGLLVVTFGLNVAILYFTLAMAVSVLAGFLLEKLGFERFVRDEAYLESRGCNSGSKNSEAQPAMGSGLPERETTSSFAAQGAPLLASVTGPGIEKTAVAGSCSVNQSGKNTCANKTQPEAAKPSRWFTIWLSTWKDFKKTLPYLLIGITLGSFIYGFVPTDLIVAYAGENKWYAIPIAAVIGIPLYIRASAVIPLSAGLVQKGMALGSVMALIIGSAGASLTEVILLKSIFKTQMIAAFLTVVLGMAVTAGYLYSFLF